MTSAELPQQNAELAIEQAFQQAIAHHQAGRFQEAGELYRTILEIQPNHPEANHNMGVLAVQMKQPAAGLPYFMAALDADPTRGAYWLNYIDALFQAGQMEEARQVLALARQNGLEGDEVEALALRLTGVAQVAGETDAGNRQAPGTQEIDALVAMFNGGRLPEAASFARTMTERFPSHVFGWKALGVVLSQMGRNADALAPLQKAATLSPDDVEVHSNLGATFHDLGRLDEAEASYRRALIINADLAEAHYNLGNTLRELGRLGEAENSYRRALKIKPAYAQAHCNLGITLNDLGRPNDAEASLRRALQIRSDDAQAHSNLGNTLKELGRLGEAEASYRRALELKPMQAETHNNLGILLQDLGCLAEAEASYRRALELQPDYHKARSNLLFLLNYNPDIAPAIAFAEARRYGQRVVDQAASRFAKWSCAMRPARLRVGFVSGDFRSHPVSYFLENLLRHLDQDSFELIAYPTDPWSDELTARIKPCFSAWKPLYGMNDEAAARLIHGDGVHILIDLSGHSRYNRLPVFAWKPAPVQVSWLGYFATTGVAEIDYLIADPSTLPESEEKYFTEKIWRLPETRLCFTPPDVEVEVSPLPALANGYITFGCFNNLSKMNDGVVALWSRVLASVPGSRLFLKSKQLGEASIRQQTIERFAAHGIAADRLVMEGAESRAKYLAAYHRVDIALDPFPFPGGTTTVESLWMGVPVLNLAGQSFLFRQGAGFLKIAGLPEWIAASHEEYVARAVSHAAAVRELSELRKGLRQQVESSPIMDGKRFAGHFKSALYGMWRIWSGNRND